MDNLERKIRIETCKKGIAEFNNELIDLVQNCPHEIIRSHDSAICRICDTDFGWWCPKSPDHLCEYEKGSEWCIWCGEPTERK